MREAQFIEFLECPLLQLWHQGPNPLPLREPQPGTQSASFERAAAAAAAAVDPEIVIQKQFEQLVQACTLEAKREDGKV